MLSAYRGLCMDSRRNFKKEDFGQIQPHIIVVGEWHGPVSGSSGYQVLLHGKSAERST